jgi:hypothetical protein
MLLLMCVAKNSGKNFGSICRLALAAVLTALISACSENPQPATLDELIRRPDFQQCMLDSGVRPDQLSDCLASNPDEPSARACIQARVGAKTGGPKSSAIDRCYNLGTSPPPAPPPTGLTCYQGMAGSVTCN